MKINNMPLCLTVKADDIVKIGEINVTLRRIKGKSVRLLVDCDKSINIDLVKAKTVKDEVKKATD